jgi:glutathione S-transferase
MSIWVSLVTLLALLLFVGVSVNVGRARAKYKIAAPAVSGNLDFERVYRVQQNTLEQLSIFLPALWLFAYYVSGSWAAGLGLAWIIGRVVYAIGYYKDANKRGPGFGISFGVTVVLIMGALVGVILQLTKS